MKQTERRPYYADTDSFPADDDFTQAFTTLISNKNLLTATQTNFDPVLRPIIRTLLLLMGSGALLFGLWQQLVPRARYVSSSPAAGASLATSPTSIVVRFSNQLNMSSEMAVTSTITLSPSGEPIYGDGPRFSAKGPDPNDPLRQTMRLDLSPELPRGLYWVQWTTESVRGRARSSGRLCYAVGMTVPDYITRDQPGGLLQHDYKWREHRATLLAGVLLIALGIFLPRLGWKSD